MTSPSPPPIGLAPDGTWPMPPGAGACRTWPLEQGCGCIPPVDSDTWTVDHQHAVEFASEIMWRLTAGVYGLCHETIRPCLLSCLPERTSEPWMPALGRPWAVPCSCLERGGRCDCKVIPQIELPGPVYWEPLAHAADWTQQYRPADERPDLAAARYRLHVWVDGKLLNEPGWPVEWQPGQPIPESYTPARGDYWLYDNNRLVRTDGQPWPVCQDLANPIQPREAYPDEAAGTFGIEFWRGIPVPPAGQRAVAILACEVWKSCRNDSSCRLPRNVQSLMREGIEYTLIDPTEYLKGNRTGLPDVDMWIAAVNPYGHRQAPEIVTPDLPAFRSTRW